MAILKAVAVFAAVASLMTVGSSVAIAQDVADVRVFGHIEHGVPGTTFDPAKLTVTLNVFEGVTSLDQITTTPEPSGSFEFSFSSAPDRTYFVGVEYQGVNYSDSRDAMNIGVPILIEVFDATSDSSVLTIDSYSVIVTGALPNEGFVEILERAVVQNTSDFTLAPDRSSAEPFMPGFLRFALPPNYYNLDVRSSIVGGQVLEVDRGFAITTPVPPTRDEPHQIEFVFRLDYDESVVDLSRTMRFGATSFRFVVPDDTALPSSPQLEDLGVAELSGRLLRLLEGQNIEDGQRIELGISELPLPSRLHRVSKRMGDWYFRYGVPGFVGIALAVILWRVIHKRHLRIDISSGADLTAQRDTLLLRVRELEQENQKGSLSESGYKSERGELKRALMALELQQRLRSSLP